MDVDAVCIARAHLSPCIPDWSQNPSRLEAFLEFAPPIEMPGGSYRWNNFQECVKLKIKKKLNPGAPTPNPSWPPASIVLTPG